MVCSAQEESSLGGSLNDRREPRLAPSPGWLELTRASRRAAARANTGKRVSRSQTEPPPLLLPSPPPVQAAPARLCSSRHKRIVPACCCTLYMHSSEPTTSIFRPGTSQKSSSVLHVPGHPPPGLTGPSASSRSSGRPAAHARAHRLQLAGLSSSASGGQPASARMTLLGTVIRSAQSVGHIRGDDCRHLRPPSHCNRSNIDQGGLR